VGGNCTGDASGTRDIELGEDPIYHQRAVLVCADNEAFPTYSPISNSTIWLR
jgi:hypothetical protein